MTSVSLTLSGVVLGSPDPRALASFYERLLGLDRNTDEDEWVTIGGPDTVPHLAFQLESEHVAPVWPAGPGDPQMQVHLDIAVSDLDAAGEHAAACGATLAQFQPQDDVRVWIDPDGHPFCLFEKE
jgi:catechol 2,3-dioxygenase-like lactoylglutathione lyase family enzyme